MTQRGCVLLLLLLLAWPAWAQPSVQVYKGTFTGATSTGDQVVSGITDQAGNAFTPKLLVIWGSQQTSAATTDGLFWNLGVTDCTTQVTSWAQAEDNVATSNTDQSVHDARLLDTYDSSVSNLSRGTINGCASGQFTINWSVATGSTNFLYHFVALGGSGFGTAVQKLVPGDPSTPSADAATVIANGMWFWPVGTTANGVNTFLQNVSLGWWARQANNSYQQMATWTCSENAQGATDARKVQITTAAFLQNAATCTSSGLAFAFSGNYGLLPIATNNEWVWTAALSGVEVKAGAGLQPTTNGTQAITSLGFTPVLVMFASYGEIAQAIVSNQGRFSYGAATAAAQGQIWLGDLNAADPTVNARTFNTSSVIIAATPDATGSSSTVQAQASLQSLDSDGFTLNWTTTDATQRQYVWFAIGVPDAPAPSGERSYAY